jgi:hypothetical protein
MLSFFRQFAERTDSSSSSTFLRSDGLKASSGDGFLVNFLLRLFEVDEDAELVLQNTGGVGNGIFAADRTVGFDVSVSLS